MEKKADERLFSILIVDDVAKNIQLVAKYLTREGYDLYFAQNGDAAIKQTLERSFDLVLLDVMMPGMDGYEVCRIIKSSDASMHIPVIFLTAKTDDEAIAKGFAAGGVDYVTKPFNPSELIARVKTHIQLQQREKELRELNKTKDTLLSVISHDLKTPFFNIIGLGDILLTSYNDFPDEEKRELITNMVDAARSSHNLLDNLLNWTRVQTGKITYEPKVINIHAVAAESIELSNAHLKNKEIDCKIGIDENIKVFADQNMLSTILRNLISNAIKYTPSKGNIEINAITNRKEVTVNVSDNGIGMSAEQLKSLLTKEKVFSTPGTNQEPGSGFGLVITKEFVGYNKGTISAQSSEGKGTIFSFTLPAAE